MSESDDQLHDETEYARLIRFCLRASPRFGLALATFSDLRVARQVQARATRELESQELVTSIISLAHSTRGGVIDTIVDGSSRADIIWLTDVVSETNQDALTELNLGRDELPHRITSKVILWLEDRYYGKSAQRAWDLFQVMLTRFSFRQRMITEPLETSEHRAHPISYGNSSVELEQAQRLLTLASQSSLPLTRADAYASAANLFYKHREYEQALTAQSLAVTEYDNVDPIKAAYGRAVLSVLEDLRENIGTAHALAKDACSSLESLCPESITHAKAIDILASHHEVRGELLLAYTLRSRDHIPLLKRLGHREEHLDALIALGRNLRLQKRLDEAIALLTHTAQLLVEAPSDHHLTAYLAGELAAAHLDKGEPDIAAQIQLEQQLPALEEIGPSSQWASALKQLATTRIQQGDLEEALRIQRKLRLPMAMEIGDRWSEHGAHADIAHIQFRLKRWPDAISEQRKALDLSNELGVTYAIVVDKHSLALMLATQPEPLRSLEANRNEIAELMRSVISTLRELNHPLLPDFEAKAERLGVEAL